MKGEEPAQQSLSERAQHLLKTLVDLYIREGQPVGSRTLSRDSGLELSPATVRNVMSDLEEMGYITAPHTSAGRVPTIKGYRLFVDSLLKVRPLSASELERFQRELQEPGRSVAELASIASHLLSGVTRLAGVVTLPRQRHGELRQIEFLPLTDHRVLAILVVNEHEVQNRVLQFERVFTESELTAAANYLNAQFAGKDIAEVRRQLVDELQRTRESMNQAMLDAIRMAHEALATPERELSGLVMAGETNLMDFHELSNMEKLRQLFDAFNRKRDILSLLDQSLSAQGVQIFIGQESGFEMLEECSIVTAPYTLDDEVIGVLGVIGPTRMPYSRVIPIVDATARMLGSALKSQS